MALAPGEEIGEEVHDDGDQFFRVEERTGEVWINGNKATIESDTGIVAPAGSRHSIKNTSEKPLYAPLEHRAGTVQTAKADAKASSQHFDLKTTE